MQRSSVEQRRLTDDLVKRLERIAAWRAQKLSLRDIRALLEDDDDQPSDRIVALVPDLHQRVQGVATLAQEVAARRARRGQR